MSTTHTDAYQPCHRKEERKPKSQNATSNHHMPRPQHSHATPKVLIYDVNRSTGHRITVLPPPAAPHSWRQRSVSLSSSPSPSPLPLPSLPTLFPPYPPSSRTKATGTSLIKATTFLYSLIKNGHRLPASQTSCTISTREICLEKLTLQ